MTSQKNTFFFSFFLIFSLLGCKTTPQPFNTLVKQVLDDSIKNTQRADSLKLIVSHPEGKSDKSRTLYRTILRTSDNPTLKGTALGAIIEHGNKDDIPLVIDQVNHSQQFIRLQALRVFQYIHTPQAIPLLIKHLRSDPSSNVRVTCGQALRFYQERQVLLALINALSDNNFSVCVVASHSLTYLTGKNFGVQPLKWQTWLDNTDKPFKKPITSLSP